MTIRKALVTGAAGFIGSHVVRSLLERYPGIHIRAMHLPNDNLINLQQLPVELFAGDITSRADMDAAVDGCDAVFHLAAIFALWLPDPTVMDKVNVDGTRTVLQACVDAGVPRVVYTSSYAVFGGQGQGVACDESSPFRLHASHYSVTKHRAHQVAREFANGGLDLVIVCPTAPVGPGDYGPTPTGKLFIDFASAPVNTVMKSGSNYVDVRDCALGHVLAFEKGRSGESYILGGDNYTVAELVALLEQITGQTRLTIKVAPWMLMPAAWVSLLLANHVTGKAPLLTPADLKTLQLGLWADAGKARRELGLPGRPIEESIRDALDWFAAHGYLDARVKRRLGYS